MSIRILIADDEQPARFGMARALRGGGCQIDEAADGPSTLEAIRTTRPDLVFLDLNMPGQSGLQVLEQLGPDAKHSEIVVVTANDSIASAVECVRLGAADYIAKPYEVEQLRAVARRVTHRRELEDRVAELQSRLDERQGLGALIGTSRPMQQLFRQIERAAAAPVDVLIRGETGTGKELVARELHRLSPRADGPFVAVNTAAIAASLAESELFGHVKGAFTGASADRSGVFQQAHGGTLFLDEIGDMPLDAQAKILRTLQERVVQPVGSSKTIPVDVRVVSATHQDLEAAIAAGAFRRDLFYRVRGFELSVPPLRARREDVLLLARHFIEHSATQRAATAPELESDAARRLLAHAWPGNVRELHHALQAAAAIHEDGVIRAADLPLPSVVQDSDAADFARYADLPLTEAKSRLTTDFERWAITQALDAEGGNISAAARRLGIHRQNLQQKLDQLGLRRIDE